MKKHIEKFQYLTRQGLSISAVEQAQMACENGAKWLQYRNMSAPWELLINEVNEIAEICDDWGCTLLVTEHIQLAGITDVQGFHLEDMQVDISKIRNQVGDAYILGASANTWVQVLKHYENGADYVSFGPFKHTHTKMYAGECVGLKGYEMLMNNMEKHKVHIPIFAVGGIQLRDVEALFEFDIAGIAVSEAIYAADNFAEAYRNFHLASY